MLTYFQVALNFYLPLLWQAVRAETIQFDEHNGFHPSEFQANFLINVLGIGDQKHYIQVLILIIN